MSGRRQLVLHLNGGDAALFKFSNGAPFVGISLILTGELDGADGSAFAFLTLPVPRHERGEQQPALLQGSERSLSGWRQLHGPRAPAAPGGKVQESDKSREFGRTKAIDTRAGNRETFIMHTVMIRDAQLLITRLVLLLGCAMVSTATAATIAIENLATDFRGQSAVVHATRTVHLDMSGFGDLTPGEPIRLTLSATSPLLWFGVFWFGPTGVSFQHDALLQLSAGAHSNSASYSWRLPETGFYDPGPQPPNTSNIAGFAFGPRPDDLTLVVPWGTDLSDVQVTLVEDSLATGAGSTYSQSSIAFTGQAGTIGSPPLLHVESVPEPNAFGLLASGIAAASSLRRRRSALVPARG